MHIHCVCTCSESETLKEDCHIDVPQVHSGAERESVFSHSAEEPQITNGDEQHNNASFPEVPTHIAVHLPVLVRCSSTLCHHVETAELSFTEDSVVFVCIFRLLYCALLANNYSWISL